MCGLIEGLGRLVLVPRTCGQVSIIATRCTGGASASGIQQVIVGTGGTALRPFPGSPLPTTEIRNANTHGVLRLDLSSTGAEGRFIPVQGFGSFTDQFSVSCS